MNAVSTTLIVGQGSSMDPAVRAQDLIRHVPCFPETLRPGDVIVFRPPGVGYLMVHRIVANRPQGILTKGDNNDFVDPWILSKDGIVGRVVEVFREGRRLTIYRGAVGWGQMVTARVRRWIAAQIIRFHQVAGRQLRPPRMLDRWLKRALKGRVITIRRSSGIELQFLVGRRVIARRPSAQGRWHIRWPFNLFLDKARLLALELDPPSLNPRGRSDDSTSTPQPSAS
jgi:signal peptidase I